MVKKDNDTEQKILNTAEEVFHQKGFDGTRMQEIAEVAGINKGLLHYYFKTKNKLFEAIFGVALNRMVSKITSILEMDIPLEDKIDTMVEEYMNLLLKHPKLPRFVLNELNKQPDTFVAKHLNENAKKVFNNFEVALQKEVARKSIKPIDGRHLLINIISLVIFPFIGRPMMQGVFGIDNAEFQKLLLERKTVVKKFLKDAIKA